MSFFFGDFRRFDHDERSKCHRRHDDDDDDRCQRRRKHHHRHHHKSHCR